MSALAQSADLVITDPLDITKPPLKLMLVRNGNNEDLERKYSRTVFDRLDPSSSKALLESQMYWDTFHLGIGHGRTTTHPGKQPGVIAEGDADTRFPYAIRVEPARTELNNAITEAVLVFAHAGNVWVVAGGTTRTIYKTNGINSTGTTTTAMGASATPISWCKFDGNVYIAVGFSEKAYKIDSAGVITQATDVLVKWKYVTVDRDRMWFSTTDNQIRSCLTGSDPFDPATWTGPLDCGETSTKITGLLARDRIIYIGKEDGLYAFDTDLNLINLMPDLRDYVHQYNCAGMVSWHQGIVIPHQRGLYYYTEGAGYTSIGPERVRVNSTNSNGIMRALLADGLYIWGIADAPAKNVGGLRTLLYVGRERYQDEPGDGPIVWHVLADIPRTTVNPIAGMALFNDRLYFCNDAGKCYYIGLRSNGYQPFDLGTATGTELFDTSDVTFCVLPTVNMDNQFMKKMLYSMSVDLENMDAVTGRVCSLWYSPNPADANPVWIQLGATISSNGTTEFLFPNGLLLSSVGLRIALATGLSTESPVVRGLMLSFIERPNRNALWRFEVRIGRGIVDRHGNTINNDPFATYTLMEKYARPDGFHASVITPWGEQRNVVITSVAMAPYQENKATETGTHVMVIMMRPL